MNPNAYRNLPGILTKKGSFNDEELVSGKIVPESVMYVIYCHGKTLHGNILLPHLLSKIVFFNYVVDVGYVLLGGEQNILDICDINDEPRERKKSGDVVNNMKLYGGPPIDRELGVYICRNNPDGTRSANLIFDMTNDYPPPYEALFDNMINSVFVYHNSNHPEKGIRIIMHTCRGYENHSVSVQSMKPFTVDEHLADMLSANLDIKDSMDISTRRNGGKRKSKRRKSLFSKR